MTIFIIVLAVATGIVVAFMYAVERVRKFEYERGRSTMKREIVGHIEDTSYYFTEDYRTYRLINELSTQIDVYGRTHPEVLRARWRERVEIMNEVKKS